MAGIKWSDLSRWYQVRGNAWFVPKFFGLGATPATWQGWLSVAIYCALVVVTVHQVHSVAAKIEILIGLTIPFVALVYMKTDGAWRFRWGGGSKD